MSIRPTLRFVQISDTHLGHGGQRTWHNLNLFDDAAAIAADVVEQINELRPDFVVHTGDLTHAGTPAAFRATRELLRQLDAPLYLIPGNHDVELPGARAALLDAFAERFPTGQTYQTVDRDGFRFVFLDAHWLHTDGELLEHLVPDRRRGMALPDEELVWLESELQAHPETPTLVFNHLPLFRSPRIDVPGRFTAGYLRNGGVVFEILRRHPQVKACFVGHQHFNEIVAFGSLLHAQTASLIEYPLTFREVGLFADRLEIRTHQARLPDVLSRSLAGNDWVLGEPDDLTWTHRFGSPALRS